MCDTCRHRAYLYLFPAMGSSHPFGHFFFFIFIFVNNFIISFMYSYHPNYSSDNNQLNQLNQMDQMEIDFIKQTMMQGLGFTKVPDITKMNVSQEEYSRMYGIYLKRLALSQHYANNEGNNGNNNNNDGDGDNKNAGQAENLPKLYTFHQKHKEHKKRHQGIIHLTFNVPTKRIILIEMSKERRVMTNEKHLTNSYGELHVEHSTLRMLANKGKKTGPVRVQVYQVKRKGERILIDERDIHLADNAPKWCEMDITNALKSWWLEETEDNIENLNNTKVNYSKTMTAFTLELHCKQCQQNGHSLLTYHTNNHNKKKKGYHTGGDTGVSPVINAVLKSRNIFMPRHTGTGHKIHKRTISSSLTNSAEQQQTLFYEQHRRTDCRNKNSKRCCRHKMDFDLSQLGLDFIIQPKRFDGGICQGRCPPHYNAAHNHAVLQSLLWKRDRRLAPRVCCAPSRLSSLEILTIDEDDPEKLSVRTWDNMIVLECACT